MLKRKLILRALFLAASFAPTTLTEVYGQTPSNAATIREIDALYRTLIDAENRHDLAKVRTMVWESPSMLFVAKTATAAEGNWAGFWGTDIVVQHLGALFSGTFAMAPDYSRVKTVMLTDDVAETYAPLDITVSYAGQTPVAKPFLMIVEWIRTPAGWRMATDVAVPVPPAP
jgi:predicted TIM-barrel enzyme